MHSGKNGHRYLWLLSGTREGPLLASAFLKKGWKVSVSVVTAQASLSYEGLPLEDIWVGSLNGVEGIKSVLEQAKKRGKNFEWVVDATHPFAVFITSNLHRACKEALQPLIRFDRPLRDCSKESLITSSTELSNKFLEGKNVLFAIGSRHLHEAVVSARKAGANTFARVLPTPESLRQALASGIPGNQIAVMHPFKGEPKGQIEQELCRSWLIDCVVCRESGGITQELWQEISNKNGIDIFMISRPELFKDLEVVHTLKALIDRVGIS